MDHLHRVVRLSLYFLVGLLFGCVSVLAQAATTYQASGLYGMATYSNADDGVVANQYCPTLWAGYTYQNDWRYLTTGAKVWPAPDSSSPQRIQCYVKEGAGAAQWVDGAYMTLTNSCPQGGTLSGAGLNASCIDAPDCTAPDVRDYATGACVPPPAPPCLAKGTAYSSGYYLMGTSTSAPFNAVTCTGSCLVSFAGYVPGGVSLVNGISTYYAQGEWQYLGPNESCSGVTTPIAVSAPPPATCGANQYYGTINGKEVCVDATTGQPTSTTPATPGPTTTSTTTTNPDNSTTTTGTTTNPDGSTTTTVTTTSGDGTSTTTSTTYGPAPGSDPQKSVCESNPSLPECKASQGFCAENPDSSVCKTSSFGGACGAFTCDGDAIQCAIARDQHQRNCALFDEANIFSDLIDQASPAGDAALIAAGEAALNKDGASDFNMWTVFQQKQQTYMQFASECPTVMAFDFKSDHFEFDTSVLCEIGKILKLLLHFSAYMVCLGMFARMAN